MRVNLEDLTKYAYCPVFYQNNHPLVKESNPIIDILRVEAIYLWGRQLEVGYKITRKGADGKVFANYEQQDNYATFVLKGTNEHVQGARAQGIQLPAVGNPEPFINRNVP